MTAYRHGSTRPPTGHGIAERPAVDRFRAEPAVVGAIKAWTEANEVARDAYQKRARELERRERRVT